MITMTEEDNFIDFATVRDMLESAQERRGDLTYEPVSYTHLTLPTIALV